MLRQSSAQAARAVKMCYFILWLALCSLHVASRPRRKLPVKILFATTEAVPFAKTGGLGDVCGSLPQELAKLGHEPVVIMPAFRQALNRGRPIEPTGVSFEVPIGRKMVGGTFLRSSLPGGNVPVYLVEHDAYYDRPELYTRARPRLQGQLRAVRVLLPGRCSKRSSCSTWARSWSTATTGRRPRARVSENRVLRRAAVRFARVDVHDPQHRLPGQLLALGHGAHRHRLEVFQLAADGVLRQPQLPQERHRVRRRDHAPSARGTPRRSNRRR